MHSQDFFYQAMIYLLAAVVSVPIAKRLGLGSVLGYLLAGIAIGPFVLGLIGEEGADVMHFAEFGVVMMLFLIGLELKPSLLWKLRKSIFGLGGGQVVLTALIIGAISLAVFGLNLSQSLTVGLTLALSSTAIVLQSLAEKGLMKTRGGESSFTVLLFQDIAVIPILAILPLLAADVAHDLNQDAGQAHSGVGSLAGWQQLMVIIGVVAAIIFIGKFLARYIFRIIASTGMREIFTAAALLLVVAIAVAMNAVGLSPALGTFLAGVVLADNEYRHELEADIDPFKGLLLGLFFIAVGAGIDFNVLFNSTWLILGLLTLLILVKFGVLFGLGKLFGLKSGQEMLFSFSLAQGGEFAFVLISFSRQNAIYDDEIAGILLIVVALSMAITPLLLLINEKIVQPIYVKASNKMEEDKIDEAENPVILAGFGRFGVIVGRFLKTCGIQATILDNNPDNVQVLRKFGFKVYYGDASRHDLLESAGIATAKILILAIDDKDKNLEIVEFVKKKFPHVKIFTRAYDVRHMFALKDKKADYIRRENYDSSLELVSKAVCELGFDHYQSHRALLSFKFHDQKIMDELFKLWKEDDRSYIKEAKRFSSELEKVFLAEREESIHESDMAWDSTTLREEVREIYAEIKEGKNEHGNDKS